MKKGILILTILLLQATFLMAQKDDVSIEDNVAVQELNWIENYDEAQRLAQVENKPMFIFFTGSDWCGICKMLDKDFLSSDEFKKIASEKLILYKADFPRRTDLVSPEIKSINEELSNKYSKTRSKRVFPTVVLTNANGKEIGFIESYNYIHDTTRHFGLLSSVLK